MTDFQVMDKILNGLKYGDQAGFRPYDSDYIVTIDMSYNKISMEVHVQNCLRPTALVGTDGRLIYRCK
jgi:hypothetical protein